MHLSQTSEFYTMLQEAQDWFSCWIWSPTEWGDVVKSHWTAHCAESTTVIRSFISMTSNPDPLPFCLYSLTQVEGNADIKEAVFSYPTRPTVKVQNHERPHSHSIAWFRRCSKTSVSRWGKDNRWHLLDLQAVESQLASLCCRDSMTSLPGKSV